MDVKKESKVTNIEPKGGKREPKGHQVVTNSADPRSGVLDHLETGEVYLPLPPPPWALRRQTLVPIGLKTLYTYIGSTFWPMGTKSCDGGLGPLWVQFWLL